MALKITPTIADNMFISEFAHLCFSDVPMERLLVELFVGSSTRPVFAEEYVTDSNGEVNVYDLDQILEEFPDEYYTEVTLRLNRHNGRRWTARVFRCNAAVNVPGDVFLHRFFMSASEAERDTSLTRFERITGFVEATPENPRRVMAVCSYMTEAGDIVEEVTQLDSLTSSGIVTVDASASRFVKPSMRLLRYSIACESRMMSYRVDDRLPDGDPAFIFRNCFNAWEYFYLTGKKETAPTFERSQAMVNGRLRSYDIKETRTFKAMTGPLRAGLEEVGLDLGRSAWVYLIDEQGNPDRAVTITGSDIKCTNEETKMNEMTFDYRLSGRRNSMIVKTRIPKIFDDSFDDTFE